MTKERFLEIFKEDSKDSDWIEDNAFKGLCILSKYLSTTITRADLDVIYSVSPETLIYGGITEKDCIALKELNWFISWTTPIGCLACCIM